MAKEVSGVAEYAIAKVLRHGSARQRDLSYQWGHTAEERLVTVTPASPEMMQLLRDEHGLIADMLKVQIAKGKW